MDLIVICSAVLRVQAYYIMSHIEANMPAAHIMGADIIISSSHKELPFFPRHLLGHKAVVPHEAASAGQLVLQLSAAELLFI